MVSNYFEKKRSLALGIASAGAGIGTLTLAPLVELMVGSLGWAHALMVLSGIVLLGIPLSVVFKPIAKNESNITESPHDLGKIEDAHHMDDAVIGSNSNNLCIRILECMRAMGASYLKFFQHLLFVIFLLANFFVYIGFGVPFAFTVVSEH